MGLYAGKTLGVIGLDENGLPLLWAAQQLGLNVFAYVDEPRPYLTRYADQVTVGNYRDKLKLKEFGEACDVVVYVTANIDAIVFRYLSRFTQVVQGIDGLEIMQDRVMERAFLDELNVNIAPYVTVISLDDVYQSIDSIGFPAVLRPIQRGMGAKSMIIRKQSDIALAANFMQAGTYLLESWIDHAKEYALTVATNGKAVETYPLTELTFTAERNLKAVSAPVIVAEDLQNEMERITKAAVKQLGYQGILTVEFYVTASGNLYVKGLQPGITTAGNVFQEAASVSLARQMVRLAAGMPPMPVAPGQPTQMMITYPAQLQGVMRQQVLKENWHYAYYLAEHPQADQVVGLVWAVGTAEDGLPVINEQLDATGIWDEKPAEPASDGEASEEE